jgi:hypothetical protein
MEQEWNVRRALANDGGARRGRAGEAVLVDMLASRE